MATLRHDCQLIRRGKIYRVLDRGYPVAWLVAYLTERSGRPLPQALSARLEKPVE